jgi:hypothetical protein
MRSIHPVKLDLGSKWLIVGHPRLMAATLADPGKLLPMFIQQKS